jgi:hypothetical protein
MPVPIAPTTPKDAIAPVLLAELRALNLTGVRDYTLTGQMVGDRVLAVGVYAWDETAPAGEYQHKTLAPQQRVTIVAALDAHDPSGPSPAEQQQAERTAATTDVQATYQAAVTRLDAIIANGGTFTAAQVRDAVVDLARIQRRMLRLLKAQG